MEVEIIKKELEEYKAGDVLLVHNAYEGESKTYLLYQDVHSGIIGAIDLADGLTKVRISLHSNSFEDVITICEEEINSTESHVFKSNETKLILGGLDS